MFRVRYLALATCVSAALTGCSGEFQPGPAGGVENLLLVTFDTTRADHIGCYGHETASTPTLDSLARDGALFERCFAPAPLTLPSHSTLLTGFQPYTHGARNNGTHKLGADVRSMAERLKEEGFSTGAVISSFVLDSRFGLDSGFDTYDDDLSGGTGQGNFGFAETIAEDTTRRALEWLERRGTERWFLWIHYFDPHSDYSAPEPFGSRFARSPYDGEIAYTDDMFGDVIEHLRSRGELEETLVVVTSDHGESLGEHGENTHGLFIYDATTHVPLVMSHPGLPGDRRIPDVVGLVDIAPTTFDLLGVAYGSAFDGRSFASVLLSKDATIEPRPAYSESIFPRVGFGWAELRALRGENWRYVRAPRPELYDIERDPGELDDLSGVAPERLARRAAELSAILPEKEVETYSRDGGEMDPEVEELISALGYAGSDLSGDSIDGGLADPKDKLSDLKLLREAEAEIAYGREDEAEAMYRRLIATNPNSVDARNPLADLLWRMGKLREAVEVQREIVRLPGVKSANFAALAALEHQLGVGDVATTLQLAKACDPRDPAPWVLEGSLIHGSEDPEAALAAYQTALRIDSKFAKAWIGICEIEASRRNLPEALAAADQALDCDPSIHAPWFHKGSMLAASGKHREAIRCFTRASEIDPDHLQTRQGLTILHNTLGQKGLAIQQLGQAVRIDRAAVEKMAAGNPAIATLLLELR